MAGIVYKICSADEWSEACRGGRYLGSKDDLRDGFIHLSTAQQLPGTLMRHFSDPPGWGRPGLVLVAFQVGRLADTIKWEPARDGSLFPHVYGPLDTALAASVMPLAAGADGRHILPGDMCGC